MAPTSSPAGAEPITLREVEPRDLSDCARICFEAFGGIHDHHRFPRDFPALEAATGMLDAWIAHPQVWGVVAESGGRVVGSNFVDERDPVPGIGPITVDPVGQNSGVGRKLMDAVVEWGHEAPSMRLVQDGFHMRSLSLYTALGFRVTASCVVMNGTPGGEPDPDVEVRPVTEDDLGDCGALCESVHGFARTGALRDAIHALGPVAAVRDGRIVAYATSVNFWPMAHGVAESDADLQALLLGAAANSDEPLALLAPLRSELFPWCLAQGMRGVKPMNVMTRGEYFEPRAPWFPSVLY